MNEQMRIFSLMLAAVMLFSLLIGRLYYIQVVKASDLLVKSQRAREGKLILQPSRGFILDRNQRVLAANQNIYTVKLDKYLAKDWQTSLRRLSLALDLSTEAENKAFEALNSDGAIARPIQSGLTEKDKERIDREKIPGVAFDSTQTRVYPEQTLASHLLGWTGKDNEGRSGIEYAMDDELKGVTVAIDVAKDVRRIIVDHDYTKEVRNHGVDVVLTIDSYIQHVVERELRAVRELVDAEYVNAVVMHPKTGEVLAMANYPTFDPNRWQEYPDRWRQNRMLTDLYEPGSVIKPFVVAAALDQNRITPDSVIYCEDGFYYVPLYRKTISDDNGKHRFGNLSVKEVIAFSSNIGTVKIARTLGETPDDFRGQAVVLHDYLTRFGFKDRSDSKTTVIEGESGGILRPPSAWKAASLGAVPFGQEMATNTLVLAGAYSMLANRGVYQEPYLIKGYRTADKVYYPVEPKAAKRRVNESAVEPVVDMLVEVTEHPEGTGRRVRLPGFHVAGKTGTAQKAVPGQGYVKGKRIATFAGFFPAEDPQVCIVVMVDEPKGKFYGGEVAGPVWLNIAKEIVAYWGMAPTDHDDPALQTGTAEKKDAKSLLAKRTDTEQQKTPGQFGAMKRLPVFTDGERGTEAGLMPNLIGLTKRDAYILLTKNGLEGHFSGSGKVVSQEIPAGESVDGVLDVGSIACETALVDPTAREATDLLAQR